MYFEDDFRLLGEVDTEALASRVSQISECDWRLDSHRQHTYEPHIQTQTIPLRFDEDLRHSDATDLPAMSKFSALLEPIYVATERYYRNGIRQKNLARRYGEPYFQRIILVRLSGGGAISPHQDHGFSLARCHRIHLPLVTHSKVLFQVGGSQQCLLPGQLWEINNRRVHSVQNNAEAPRIHLILDYVIPGEKIFEPDAVLQA